MGKNKSLFIILFVLCTYRIVSFAQSNPVEDLTAFGGYNLDQIKLVFTYPGPDVLPQYSCYYIKYSTYLEGVEWSTATANIIISTSNVYPSEQQTITVSNLYGNNTYYFHLWISSGTEQLLSEISNRATYYLSGEVLMEIYKSHLATTKRPGEEITYFIQYRNVGNIGTIWFKIEDKIPSKTKYKQNSIKVNNVLKTDESDEEEGPDAEFTDGKIRVFFDDAGSQVLPQESGIVEFKVIIE